MVRTVRRFRIGSQPGGMQRFHRLGGRSSPGHVPPRLVTDVERLVRDPGVEPYRFISPRLTQGRTQLGGSERSPEQSTCNSGSKITHLSGLKKPAYRRSVKETLPTTSVKLGRTAAS